MNRRFELHSAVFSTFCFFTHNNSLYQSAFERKGLQFREAEMAATKTMFMHLLDGGASMNENITPAKDSITKFALVKSIISSFTLQRMLASKTVECGLLCATGEDALKECVELRRPSAATLKLIQDMEQEGDDAGNLIGGLSEAHDILMETNQGKKFNRVMVMYTDGQNALSADGGRDLQSIQRDFNDNGILFYLLVLCDQSRDDLSTAVSDNIAQYHEFAERWVGRMICDSLLITSIV
jgi:hypothetical protein